MTFVAGFVAENGGFVARFFAKKGGVCVSAQSIQSINLPAAGSGWPRLTGLGNVGRPS
jgi:hypothetical protein